MRILFLTHYFAPEVNAPAARTLEHGRIWVDYGHELTVLTCVPNHPKGKIYPGFRNRLIQSEEIEGIKVYRVFTFAAENRRFFKRIFNYLTYFFMVIFTAPFLPRTDVVISTSPQFFAGLAGYFVSRIKRVPWVLEIRDLWPESAIAVGAINRRSMIRLAEWLESFMYRKADCIISVTDSFVPYIVEHGGVQEKIHVIKNGVDLTFYNPDVLDQGDTLDSRLEGKCVAAYVGTHGMAHGLETVLRAADKLRSRDDIVFLLVGEGAEKSRLKRKRNEMGLDNVVMLDQQPKSRMPLIWQQTDISLVLLRDVDLFRSVIPSKIVEGMAMKKPVVLGVRGEAQQLVNEAEAGVCIQPENADELAEAVVRLAEDPGLSGSLGDAGRSYVERLFSRQALAARYEAVLSGLVLVSGEKEESSSEALNKEKG